MYWGESVLDGGFRDSFNRYGVIGNYTAERVRAVGGFLFGENEDPSGIQLDNNGWFVEVDAAVKDDTVLYVRWDKFARDLAAGGELETEGPTLGISWLPSELTRITVEAQALDTDSVSEDSITAEVHITF